MISEHEKMKVKDLLFLSEEEKCSFINKHNTEESENVWVFSLNAFDRKMGRRPLFYLQNILNTNIYTSLTDISSIECHVIGSGDKQHDIYTDLQIGYILPQKIKKSFDGTIIDKKFYYVLSKIYINISMCNYNDTTNIDVDFIYSPKKEDHYRWERISLKVSKEKGFYIKEGLRYKPFCIRDESCRLANFAYCNLIEAIVTSLDLAWNAPVLYSVGEEMCNYKAYYFPPISLNRLAGYQYVDEAIRGLTNETDSLVNYSKLPFNVGYYLALIMKFVDPVCYPQIYEYRIRDLNKLLIKLANKPPEKYIQREMIKVFFIDYYNKKDKRFSRNVTEELFEVFRKNKRKLRLDLSYDEIVTEK